VNKGNNENSNWVYQWPLLFFHHLFQQKFNQHKFIPAGCSSCHSTKSITAEKVYLSVNANYSSGDIVTELVALGQDVPANEHLVCAVCIASSFINMTLLAHKQLKTSPQNAVFSMHTDSSSSEIGRVG